MTDEEECPQHIHTYDAWNIGLIATVTVHLAVGQLPERLGVFTFKTLEVIGEFPPLLMWTFANASMVLGFED